CKPGSRTKVIYRVYSSGRRVQPPLPFGDDQAHARGVHEHRSHRSRPSASGSLACARPRVPIIFNGGRVPVRNLLTRVSRWLGTAAAPICLVSAPMAGQSAEASSEELVFTKTSDGVTDAGALFTPRGAGDRRVAIIWIHGGGVNFYYPSYVKVARELAGRGLTTIVGNTRMHDLGNIEAFRETANVRGGSYWGITT